MHMLFGDFHLILNHFGRFLVLMCFKFYVKELCTRIYGSLCVTLCFVLCPFDFGVLSIHFCMLSSLLVYNVAHFKRRNSRGRSKMEKKRGKKDESTSILIHPS